MIIDGITRNKKRFAAWASEYVNIPPQMFVNGLIRREDLIIDVLIEKGVFTVEALRTELKRRRIFISERFFKKHLKK